MSSVEITFPRALKVWWSYVWRTFVLFIPLWIVLLPLMFLVLPFPKAGVKPDPAQLAGAVPKFFLIWLFFMVGNVVIQVLAMRWMLKSRWSDFRLTATND